MKGGNEGERDIFAALTKPAKLRTDYTQVGISIPKAHMRVLELESNMMGLRRGQFLELLFLNTIGAKSIVRMSIAPKYEFQREELEARQKYLWYVRNEVKKFLDEDLLQRGIGRSTWIVDALNDWAALHKPISV